MAVTVEQFVERVVEARVLAADGLPAVREEAAAARGDVEAFVRRLVERGTLAAYQTKLLWKGEGDRLRLGNYVVEDELGRGGMGVVLRGRHARMKRQVAIKVLPTRVVGDADVIARFQREVEAAAQLVHPNIVAAYDADEIDGQQILVMEFVDGRDLSAIVRQRGPLTPAQGVDCVVQAARGLEFAHSRGVIHRDVKPANLLLDGTGTVKILDMGLARFDGVADIATRAELTGTGTVMGTVDYMSPEQATSTRTADARSDLYSLGITLWYLLTGRPAYEGESMTSRLLAHAQEPIPQLADHVPDLPPGVQGVFERMVAKQPEDRFATMGEAIAALAASLGDAGGAGSTVTATAAASGAGEGLTDLLRSLDDPTDLSDTLSRSRAAAATAAPSDELDADELFADELVDEEATAEEGTAVSRPTSNTVRTAPRHEPAPSARRAPTTTRLPSWAADRRVHAAAGTGLLLLVLGLVFAFRGPPEGTGRAGDDDVLGAVLPGPADADAEPVADPDRIASPPPEGPDNRSLVFDGPRDVVRLPEAHGDGGDLTVEAWVRTNGYRSGEILRISDGAGGSVAFEREPSYGGFGAFHVRGDQVQRTLGGDGFDERWHHLCAVSTTDGLVLYVDGRPAWRPAVGEDKRSGGGSSRLGNVGHDDFWFDGELDEIRLSRGAVHTGPFTPERRLSAGPETIVLYHVDEVDDANPALLFDSSGHDRHGTLDGAERITATRNPWLPPPTALPDVAGPDGPVIRLDEESLFEAAGVSCDPARPFTVEAFLRPRDPQPGRSLLRFGPLTVKLHRTLRWHALLRGEPLGATTLSATPAAAGRWKHLAAVWDGRNARLYHNGRLVSAYRAPFDRPSETEPAGLRLGATRAGASDGFSGDLAELRVSDVARYERDFVPARRHEPDANTLALYHADDATTTRATDASGHGHDATLRGAERVPADAGASSE